MTFNLEPAGIQSSPVGHPLERQLPTTARLPVCQDKVSLRSLKSHPLLLPCCGRVIISVQCLMGPFHSRTMAWHCSSGSVGGGLISREDVCSVLHCIQLAQKCQNIWSVCDATTRGPETDRACQPGEKIVVNIHANWNNILWEVN